MLFAQLRMPQCRSLAAHFAVWLSWRPNHMFAAHQLSSAFTGSQRIPSESSKHVLWSLLLDGSICFRRSFDIQRPDRADSDTFDVSRDTMDLGRGQACQSQARLPRGRLTCHSLAALRRERRAFQRFERSLACRASLAKPMPSFTTSGWEWADCSDRQWSDALWGLVL